MFEISARPRDARSLRELWPGARWNSGSLGATLEKMLEKMDRTTRLRLLRVLMAAAWVDGDVQPEERAFYEKLLDKLPIGKDERDMAMGYLEKPPHPAEADPMKIPPEHRETLVKLVWQVVGADSNMDPDELQAVKDLEELLLGR